MANSTKKIEKYCFISVIFEFLLIFASFNKVYADNCTTDCYQNRFLPYTGDGQRDKTIIVVNTLSNTNV